MTVNNKGIENTELKSQKDDSIQDVASVEDSDQLETTRVGLSRRGFLSGASKAAIASGLVGTTAITTLASGVDEAALPVDSNNQNLLKNVRVRRILSFRIRSKAAWNEGRRSLLNHRNNGDEDLYSNRIGNFSKTLPHDLVTGEVDPAAYNAFLAALDSGKYNDFENLPSGGGGLLINPIGALAFNMEGPDNAAVGINPPPALSSPEFAAQLGELYWMADIRDVPFSEYGSDPNAIDARSDLAGFTGYTGPLTAGAIGAEDLFRADYAGATQGPMVSQFLYRPFNYDGISVDPKIDTPAIAEFLTDFPTLVSAQNGNEAGGIPLDGTTVYPRTARDLGKVAGSDFVFSVYLRAAAIIGFRGPVDLANPYVNSTRQFPFPSFGAAHLVELIGKVHKAERHAWFQKWCIHRFLRPEAAGGRVHRIKVDGAPYPIHPDLITGSDVLDRTFSRHGSYVLPLMFPGGGPSHPSFTSGHAITAGACVTIMKAWFNENAPWPFPPVMPTTDGQHLVPYVGSGTFTMGSELNKLAHNLSFGRDMSGVHWRADDIEGNKQGEEVAIRLLREEKATYAEEFDGFSLTKFDGTTITI